MENLEALSASNLSPQDKQFLEDRNKRLLKGRQEIAGETMANVPQAAMIGAGPSLDGSLAAQALRARYQQRFGAKTNDLSQMADYESYGKRMKNLGVAQNEAFQSAERVNKKYDVINQLMNATREKDLQSALMDFDERLDFEQDKLFKLNQQINASIYTENKRRKIEAERNKIINGIIKGAATIGGALVGGLATGGSPAGVGAGAAVGSQVAPQFDSVSAPRRGNE